MGTSQSSGKCGENSGKSGEKNTLSWRLKSEWGRHRNSATKNRKSFVAFHRQKAKKQIKQRNKGFKNKY